MHWSARLCPLLLAALCACAGHGPARMAATNPTAATQAPSPLHDPRLRASPPRPPAVASPVAVPLDAATRARVPRQALTATFDGRRLHCEGVSLHGLLQATGALPAAPLHGPQLLRYVLVAARDGRRVLFSLAELDPAIGDRAAYVVDRCDGHALDEAQGPLRLLVPADASASRSLPQLHTITVVVAP